MRVVLLARIQPGSWKNDIAAGLAQLGHTVTVLSDSSPAAEVGRVAVGADLLLWARTHRRSPSGNMTSILNRLHHVGVRTASLHFDLYYGLGRREREIGQHPFWQTQTVWTADGHHRAWAVRAVNHRWCPPALGDRHLGRGTARPEFAADVAFVGSRAYHREWPYRAQLLDWLATTYGRGFAWYGPGSPLGEVRGQDLSDLYASAKVIIGDSCNPGYQVSNYWSDRIPTTLGRGGFLIHPHVDGMAAKGFTDGQTLATYHYDDFSGLRTVIARWLDDPDGRRAVTDRALELVGARHLMSHRLAQICAGVTG